MKQRKMSIGRRLASRKWWSRCGLLWVFLWPLLMLGQVQLTRGYKFPTQFAENDWLFNHYDAEIWRVQEGKWKQFSFDECTGVETCHDYLFLQFRNRPYEVVNSKGEFSNLVPTPIGTVKCVESLIVLECAYETYFLGASGELLARLETAFSPDSSIDTVHGKIGFCVPGVVYDSTGQMFPSDSLRTWGLLGSNGKWLIEPKYDFQFHFQDGFAEVWYYGVRQKINEKGEVVE
jgi:hypothetical protein